VAGKAGRHPHTSEDCNSYDRVAAGNFGDSKPLRNGVYELRIDWGPGYRVYYAMLGRMCVLLLAGGEKRKQSADIGRALGYLEDYKKRTRGT
jgi:putative addiction module killer protein